MKKLMMFAVAMVAACVAKADLITWNVGSVDASVPSWSYALIETSASVGYLLAADPDTHAAQETTSVYYKGGDNATAYIDDTSTYSSSLFWVAVLNSDNEVVATSAKMTYEKIAAYATGSSAVVAGETTSADKGTLSFTAVPEPTSGLLLLVGVAMLALKRRRA